MARYWSKNRTWTKTNAATGEKESKPYPQRYNAEQREGETELQYYRRLAKVADQRMVRLEQLSATDPYFKHALEFAYGRASSDLEIFGESNRFNTKPPEDRRLFREKIMAMRYFIESPTSTKGGIIDTYQRRADSLNEKYGTEFTWKDLAEFFGKGKADKLQNDGYGSATALYAIGHVMTAKNKIIDGIQGNLNLNLTGPEKDAALAFLNKRSLPGIKDLTKEQKQKIRYALKNE